MYQEADFAKQRTQVQAPAGKNSTQEVKADRGHKGIWNPRPGIQGKCYENQGSPIVDGCKRCQRQQELLPLAQEKAKQRKQGSVAERGR